MMAASLRMNSSFAMPFYLQSGIPIKFNGVVDDTLLVCLEAGVGQSRRKRHPVGSSGVWGRAAQINGKPTSPSECRLLG